jgi:hypothetical protein
VTNQIEDVTIPSELAEALQRATDRLVVDVAPIADIERRGLRHHRRRRAMAAVGAAATVLVAAGIAVPLASHRLSQRSVRSGAATDEVVDGSSPQPLLVLGGPTGQEREEQGLAAFDGLSQLDSIGPDGRHMWWHRDETSHWGLGTGVVLADGRKFGLAIGEMGSSLDGQYAIAEISDAGATIATHPLDLPATPANLGADVGIVGASGSRVFVQHTVHDEPLRNHTPPGSFDVLLQRDLYAYDVDSHRLTAVERPRDGQVLLADDTVVNDAPGCKIEVRRQLGAGPVERIDGGCPPGRTSVLQPLALSPDGELLAVDIMTLTDGVPDETLAIVDLRDGSQRYRSTTKSPIPWQVIAWTAPRTLSLAISTDGPSDSPTGHPEDLAPAGDGVTVAQVPYSLRNH